MASRTRPLPDDRIAPAPRSGLRRSVVHAIRLIPSYLRLLVGLFRDSRVSRVDRLLALGAMVYIVSPVDFIPDVIPFLGEVDDLFLLVLALQRLIDNAGRTVLLDHWHGDPDDLEDSSLTRVLSAASFFLPPAIRRRIKRMTRR